MKITDVCIERPVLSVVLSLILILCGIISFYYLNTRFFPNTNAPVIYVSTTLPGASAKMVETNITTPLESEFGTLPSIDYMTSKSTQGSSQITIRFIFGTDVNEMANKVRAAISAKMSELPVNTDPPTVYVGWGSDELMDVAFMDPHRSIQDIRDYLDHFVLSPIQEVAGVSEADIFGANQYAMRIWLNPKKMAALGISVDDVEKVLTDSNVQMPAGEIKSTALNYPITIMTELTEPTQFANLVVTNHQGKMVELKDIAKVALGPDLGNNMYLSLNGQHAVGIEIYNQDDSSPIEVAKSLMPTLRDIQANLPSGMRMVSFYDESTFLKAAVADVYWTILFAVFCVTVAIFLFLGNLRAVIIPVVTIPVCTISAFAVIFLFGFTINVVTLLALVLGIGLVVDDAIVMLENIHRHLETGMTPEAAAFQGSHQIAFAVIGMTICLAAVYLPAGLMQGMTAAIFREFAFTLSGTVIISGFVALTLTPMMCAKLLAPHGEAKHRMDVKIDAILEKLGSAYETLLTSVLNLKTWVVFFSVLLAIAGYFLVKSVKGEFVPVEDMGLVSVNIIAPPGASYDYVMTQAAMIQKILANNPVIDENATMVSDGDGAWNQVILVLKPYSQRSISSPDLAKKLNAEFAQVPGLNAFVYVNSLFNNGAHQDLQVTLMTTKDYPYLYTTAQAVIEKLKSYPGISNMNLDMDFNYQQYQADVNRVLASQLDVSVREIDNTLSTFLGGNIATHFEKDNYYYNVVLQAEEKYLHHMESISEFYAESGSGKLISLADLVALHPLILQGTLPHYNRLRSTTLNAQINPGYSMGQVVHYLQGHLPGLLPPDTKYAFQGLARKMLEANQSMQMIFILAFVFIYLILAALFESFLDPFIILLVVPLSVVSALCALKLTGGSLNIYTQIGLVTLVGLIAKHGILITQFTNDLRAQGQAMLPAVIRASRIRLRPILMTTAAMVFGALPLLVATGANANSRFQIGLVIVVGVLFGTLFSLFVVPVCYVLLGRFKRGYHQ